MTKLADITAQGIDSFETKNTSLTEAVLEYTPSETLTAAGAASIWGVTVMDSTAAAVNLTLASGETIGQRKLFVMSEASNSSTVTVALHVTFDPEVFTFAQAGDVLELVWYGAKWATLANGGAAV